MPGGQRLYSNLAVETTLTLGALRQFPLRQTEDFMRLLMELMKVDQFAFPAGPSIACLVWSLL